MSNDKNERACFIDSDTTIDLITLHLFDEGHGPIPKHLLELAEYHVINVNDIIDEIALIKEDIEDDYI